MRRWSKRQGGWSRALEWLTMRKAEPCAGLILLYAIVAAAVAQSSAPPQGTSGCGRLRVFDARSQWMTLPVRAQTMLRRATLPLVRAIAEDPGLGLTGVAVRHVPQAAIELGRPTQGVVLYAVSWREKTFGVNGTVSLVGVSTAGAVDRTPLVRADREPFGLSGFGVAVLPTRGAAYPEVMVASKGYKAGGGSEGEALCLRKTGSRYSEVTCPALCKQVMNQR